MSGYANAPESDDEYSVFHSSQIPTAVLPDLGNYGRVMDPIIDQVLVEVRAPVDFVARVQAYHRFLAHLASQVYLIPLYMAENVLVEKQPSKMVKNGIGNPNTLTNNWNNAGWWVVG